MKKLLMMVIMMMSLSVFAQDNAKEVNKEIKAFEIQYKNSEEFAKKLEMLHDDENVNVIVDAEVIDMETVVEPMKVLANPDKPSARMNLAVYQLITFKVKEAYKSDEPINEYIQIAIEGGKYFHNGKEYYRTSTEGGYAFVDIGDNMLMGLKKKDESYFLYYGRKLQLPSKENIINDIERQKKEKAKQKLLTSERGMNMYSVELASEFAEIDKLQEKETKKELKKVDSIKEYIQSSFQETEIVR